MNCPKCNHKKTYVLDSRFKVDKIKRRRLCKICGFRFNTYEILLLGKEEFHHRDYEKGFKNGIETILVEFIEIIEKIKKYYNIKL